MARRTTIDIDDELLRAAQTALGTHGLKDTVEAAFVDAIRRAQRERLRQRIRTRAGIDVSEAMLADTRPVR